MLGHLSFDQLLKTRDEIGPSRFFLLQCLRQLGFSTMSLLLVEANALLFVFQVANCCLDVAALLRLGNSREFIVKISEGGCDLLRSDRRRFELLARQVQPSDHLEDPTLLN